MFSESEFYLCIIPGGTRGDVVSCCLLWTNK